MHRIEQRKPTNTGLLALEALPNSELWVRGHAGQSDARFALDPATVPLLLFPSEDAVPLPSLLPMSRPISLVVPDGTWRQASKVRQRIPALRDVPVVRLPQGEPSRYRLRHEPREGGLATLEAIARAYGVLEDASIQVALERVLTLMVGRTLWSRGELDASEVVGGIPDGVVRHDPSSGAAARGSPG